MTDRSARGWASSGQRVVNAVGDHRSNDVIFGHLGRLTYRPPESDDEDVGDLSFNRIISPG